jgi:hypothetical protein
VRDECETEHRRCEYAHRHTLAVRAFRHGRRWIVWLGLRLNFL